MARSLSAASLPGLSFGIDHDQPVADEGALGAADDLAGLDHHIHLLVVGRGEHIGRRALGDLGGELIRAGEVEGHGRATIGRAKLLADLLEGGGERGGGEHRQIAPVRGRGGGAAVGAAVRAVGAGAAVGSAIGGRALAHCRWCRGICGSGRGGRAGSGRCGRGGPTTGRHQHGHEQHEDDQQAGTGHTRHSFHTVEPTNGEQGAGIRAQRYAGAGITLAAQISTLIFLILIE